MSYFSTVIYEDNLYGTTVTLQVMDVGAGRPEVSHAGVAFAAGGEATAALALCEAMGELILSTGQYLDVERVPLSGIEAQRSLSGLRVSFVDRDNVRNYLLLTDNRGEYIYVLQYMTNHHGEMLEFMAGVGRSGGLADYPEFRNTFYTNAVHPVDEDYLWGFTLEKLTPFYAYIRGNQEWARRMVGFWNTTTYYLNEEHGLWSIGLFDWVSEENAAEIYSDLYLRGISSENRRTIYGCPGAAVYVYVIMFAELNVRVGRYVVAADGISDEATLKARIERMQLLPGGYEALDLASGAEEEGEPVMY